MKRFAQQLAGLKLWNAVWAVFVLLMPLTSVPLIVSLVRSDVVAAPSALILPLLLAAGLSAGNALLEKPMKLHFGKFKGVVIAYGVILFSMVLIAGSLALAHGWRETPLNLLFAGGVSFALSDLILSGTYFGVGRERPIDLVLNYITYYAGQFLIASALVFLA